VNVLAVGVLLAGVLGLDAEGVGTEVVTLSLEKVGGEVLGAVTVEPRQSGREGGSRDTKEGSLGNNVSPTGLSLVDGLVEEVVEQEVLEVRLAAVGVGDVLEEDGSDNAATSPHEGNGRLVKLPAVLASGLLHEHEALSVGDDLGGVESLLEILEELLLVTLELGGSADELKLGGGSSTLVLDGGQASAIRVTGMPRSRALTAVHLPVPFWPALSRIFSTRAVPSSSLKYMMSRVISIRKESRTPLFHLVKTSPISLLERPRPRFMMS